MKGEKGKYIVVTAHNSDQMMLGRDIEDSLPWLRVEVLDWALQQTLIDISGRNSLVHFLPLPSDGFQPFS